MVGAHQQGVIMNLSTVFLGIIAAVAVGAAVIWWSNQPTRAELRQQQLQQSMDDLDAAMDRLEQFD